MSIEIIVTIFLFAFSFMMGNFCAIPLNEIRPDQYKNTYNPLANLSMVKIGTLLSYLLYWRRKRTVTIYSLVYKICWYVIVVFAVRDYSTGLQDVMLAHRYANVITIVMGALTSIDYVIMKVDDRRNNRN